VGSVKRHPLDRAEMDGPGFRHCPEDGYFLARIKLSSPLRSSIERCRHCSRMWFDGDE
jgi:hypothetical protein